MKSSKTMAEAFEDTLHSKRVEPKQRLVGGKFGYAFHRYPIKGGISMLDATLESIGKTNALYRKLMGKP